MAATTRELKTLLPETRFWKRVSPDTFAAVSYDDDGEDKDYLFNIIELASFEPKLPGLLDAMLEHAFIHHTKMQVSGVAVVATLELLQGYRCTFTDASGIPRLFSKIHDLSWADNLPGVVLVTGFHLGTQKVNIDGETIDMVTTPIYLSSAVNAEELEKHYPGWKARWQLGRDLGLAVDDIYQSVFTAPSPHFPSTTLNQVSFV